MSWRSVIVSNPARLRIKNESLLVQQQSEAKIPLEDISVVVLDHPEINCTHAVLSGCAAHGVALFCTGTNHLPNGVLQSFSNQYHVTKRLHQQLGLPRPRKKQIWSSIVKRKIENQALCLEIAELDGFDRLKAMALRVRSGDTSNLEAQAASYYFSRLYGNNFHRDQDIWVNAALNYGYAIIRGVIARELVAHGFLPALGLFHRSERNAFNLADDLIEPFRPLVDLYTVTHGNSVATHLSPHDKAALVGLLNARISMPRGITSVLTASRQMVGSLTSCYEDSAASPEIELPTLASSAFSPLKSKLTP